jgi:hypothetical protein
MIDRLTPQLLRGHVSHCANQSAALCHCGHFFDRAAGLFRSLKLGHTKVENLYSIIGRNEQILRLQVPVGDAPFVSRNQALNNLDGVVDCQTRRKCAIL